MSANIFLVEDEKPIITLLQYNLEKEGYKVNFAETGEEAIQNIKKNIPDLIILDWMLPDFSGIEVCKQIKKINKLKSIPVLMLTAKSEEEDKVRGFESGVDDYVTKPFSYKEILLRVKSLLKRITRRSHGSNKFWQTFNVDSFPKSSNVYVHCSSFNINFISPNII